MGRRLVGSRDRRSARAAAGAAYVRSMASRTTAGDRISFRIGYALYEWVRRADGSLVDPYALGARQALVPIARDVEYEILEEAELRFGERVLRIRAGGKDLLLSPSRDSLAYRKSQGHEA